MNKERIKKLQQFLDEKPDDSFCRFALALEYLGSGDMESARDYFEFIVLHDPSYTGVYYHLGKLYEATGAPEKALDIFQRGLHVAIQNKDMHLANELKEALAQWSSTNDS